MLTEFLCSIDVNHGLGYTLWLIVLGLFVYTFFEPDSTVGRKRRSQ